MSDPYRILNLPRSADQAAIKQAYRKLAKSLHPDRNPGNAAAEQRFKEVSQAYDLLSDPAKRARFDRGEIDAEGRPRGFGGFGAGFGRGFAGRGGGAGEGLFEKMFGGAFARGFAGGAADGAGRGGPGFEEFLRAQSSARRRARGADRRYRLEVDFVDAARGSRQRLQLAGGRTIEVDVPAGTESGKRLRLKGQGDPSALDGPRRRCPGRDPGPAPSAAQPRGPRHPCRGAARAGGRGARHAHHGADARRPGAADGAARRQQRPHAASQGQGHRRAGGGRGDQYVRLLVLLPERPDRELEAWARRHARGAEG